MKIQKTGSVSAASPVRVHGLTPCFSPFPSVVDLCSGERIASAVQDERYLIRKGQEVIVIIEELHGPCIVLGEGVILEVSARPRTPIP